MTLLRNVLPVALVALAGACAGGGQLPANYAPTRAAISAADAVGAKNEPRAALHLKMAQDQLVRAESLAREGDEHEAALMLDRARTDAEAALMITRELEARNQAERVKRDLEALSRAQQ
jgi:hypothetical protein